MVFEGLYGITKKKVYFNEEIAKHNSKLVVAGALFLNFSFMLFYGEGNFNNNIQISLLENETNYSSNVFSIMDNTRIIGFIK